MNGEREGVDALFLPEEEQPTPRVFEAIRDKVRSDLSRGLLKPGDKLPAERELALQCGSSRTAVREALRSLEMAGVIELRKGHTGGAFIREGDPAVVTQSIGDMVYLGRISLGSLTEARGIIQDAVVRLACERATEADFEALERSIERTETLTREERYEERRAQLVNFYRVLAQATGNEVMVIIVDAITDIVLTILARYETVPRQQTVRVHRRIVSCLRQRDADGAAALMVRHLKALHKHLLESAAQHAKRTAGSAVRPKRQEVKRGSAAPVRTSGRNRRSPAAR